LLISSALYKAGHKIQDVDLPDVSIQDAVRDDAFYWLAFKDPEDTLVHSLEHRFALPSLAAEDICHANKYPKLEEYDDTLFVVLGLLEYKNHEVRLGELAIFVRKNLVLSVRKDAEQSFTSVRHRCEREPAKLKHGAGFVFYALMDTVVDRYFPVIEALELELEDIELSITDIKSNVNNINRLYTLKRKVTQVRHTILPLREVVGKLYGGRVPEQVEGLDEYFRDISDHLERLAQSLETLRETITLAVQVSIANNSIEQSITTRRLAAWAAIFAVPTVFTGVWGMNFAHMPELQWTYGYPVSVGGMTLITIWLYKRLKKRGWL
jgi:magnesium transporter